GECLDRAGREQHFVCVRLHGESRFALRRRGMDLESKIAWQVVEEFCNAVPPDPPKLRGRTRRLRWKRGEGRRHRGRLQKFPSEANHVLPFRRAAHLVAETQQADSLA